uniref:Uncharacterized protein n=1 Tax=viral metagenome TaxID=1070528 RepID=A0A6C0JLY3_9ZZZZ
MKKCLINKKAFFYGFTKKNKYFFCKNILYRESMKILSNNTKNFSLKLAV